MKPKKTSAHVKDTLFCFVDKFRSRYKRVASESFPIFLLTFIIVASDSEPDSFSTGNEHIDEAMTALKNNDHKYFFFTRCCTPILTFFAGQRL